MDENTKPRRRTDLLVEELAQEILVYVDEDEAVHILNPTARVVWELCDGSHDVGQIESRLRASFHVADGIDLIADIRQTLQVFAAKRLVL
ncbi:MAG: PqqD family protein [Caldilineaceae bacterium]|nr:PqqD family protein [Caldilineaceae bacterium]